MMEHSNQNIKTSLLSVPERRLVIVFVPLLMFVLYQFLSPVSFYQTGDIYQQPEATLTTLFFYVTTVFSLMWFYLLVKQRNQVSIALYAILGAPTLYLYIKMAKVTFLHLG
jgi:hypothetical protein